MGSSLDVDGARPAVAWVASLPRAYRVSGDERSVLFALACDSFDGFVTSPAARDLAEWSGVLRSSLWEIIARLEKPTEKRPALLERESRPGRRTTFRLLRDPSGDTGQVGTRPATPDTPQVTRPATPDTTRPATRPARCPATPDTTLSLTKSMHAEHPAPGIDDQLATVRAAALAALAGVILDQPHGSQLDGRDTWAQRLRDTGWNAPALAAELTAHPIRGARSAGLLRSRLAELVTQGAPTTSTVQVSPGACPDHGTALAATGTCSSCSADHHDPEEHHLSRPRSTCRRCAAVERFAA